MSQFTVTGRFQRRDDATPEPTTEAENERVGCEDGLSRLGSRHGLTRMQIELEDTYQ